MIPPESDAEFVAGMEEVLDTYGTPCDPKRPVLRMDERPVRPAKETRAPIAAAKGHSKRVDCECERAGTASLFRGPLLGWRSVSVRERRTKVDWALEVEEPLRTRYASAEKVIPVCDDLNTRTKGAFHEAFEQEKARAIARRLEFRHTPEHGSWLNIAENELGAMTRQCPKSRRFATIGEIRSGT